MTLTELRQKMRWDFDNAPSCDEVYLDLDRRKVYVGCEDGMRMLTDDDVDEYGTFEDLLNDECEYFISDGSFDSFVPEGEPTFLAVDIDDYEVILSDDIEEELKKMGVAA